MNRTLKRLIGGLAVAAVLGFAGLTVAQSITAPQVQTVNPTTDLLQIVPRGQPQAQSFYVTPTGLTSTSGYYKSIPTTGFTFTFGNQQIWAAFAPAGTLNAGYVTFAATPSDGARECVFSTQILTNLILAANTGQTLNNAVTTLAANATVCYLYSASNTTWDRDQ